MNKSFILITGSHREAFEFYITVDFHLTPFAMTVVDPEGVQGIRPSFLKILLFPFHGIFKQKWDKISKASPPTTLYI